jgi:hypothetical protein
LDSANHHPSTPEVECHICKNPLSHDEYEKAQVKLQKILLRNYQLKHREVEEKHRKEITELKALQMRRLRSFITQEKNQKKQLMIKLQEQMKRQRKRHRNEVKQVKRKYLLQMEQLRIFSADQATKLQGELRAEYSSNLAELIKRFEDLASNTTQKLETINGSIEGLEIHLHNNVLEAIRNPSSLVVDKALEEQEKESILGVRREDLEEKRLEIERLKKIGEISEMIKEITRKQYQQTDS